MEHKVSNAGRRVPKRLIGTPCPTCRWRFRDGERYVRDAEGQERHLTCPPETRVLPYSPDGLKNSYGRIADAHVNCPLCDWPYCVGEVVLHGPDGPQHHESCHDREREIVATKRIQCEACRWWIEEGETHIETLIEVGSHAQRTIERVHVDCPEDAGERIQAEQEERKAAAEQEALAKAAAAEAAALVERQTIMDQMTELRERYASGDIPSDYMNVVMSTDSDWSKIVNGINEAQLNNGGYAYSGEFIKPGRVVRVPMGAVILGKWYGGGNTHAVVYRADPTIRKIDDDDDNCDNLRHIASYKGASWANKLFEPIKDALAAGLPAHLIRPEPVVATEPEESIVPPDVMAAVELLSGLGYRLSPPNELMLNDGQPEWDE